MPVYSLAADAASATTLWAGTEGGVFRSLDGGGTWSQTGTVAGVVRALYSSAGIPARLFTGTDAGLFVSTDGGAGWAPVAAGFPAAVVHALGADEARSALYAGTSAGVVENLAGHWKPVAQGLTNPEVRSLALLPDGTLLAGTQGGSVFRRVEAAERGPISRATGRGVPRTLPPRP